MIKFRKLFSLLAAAATTSTLTAMQAPVCADETADDLEAAGKPAYVEDTDYDVEEENRKYEQMIATLFGDVNFDRLVGIADAVQLQRYLLGETDELGNWMNADLNHDGVINVRDFTLLKQQITGLLQQGGTILITAMDMMTGEPLEGVRMQLHACYDDYYGYVMSDWTTGEDETAIFTGVPTGPKYVYTLDIDDVPDGYGNEFNNYGFGNQLIFSFDEGETSKAINVRLLSNDTERNIRIQHYDWTMDMDTISKLNYGFGRVFITSQTGDWYYYGIMDKECALPDGDYHAQMIPFTYEDVFPLRILQPDSDFVTKHLKERYPDIEFTDKSGGIDFSVRNGKPDKDIIFDFEPQPGATNYITVNCIDGETGLPLEGVEISLIEAPDTYAKKVATWVSDSTGTHTFDGLLHTGYAYTHAYKVCVEGLPADYEGGYEEDVCFGYVHGYQHTVTYLFGHSYLPKNISADIIKYEDKSLMNDYAAFDVYRIDPADPLNSDTSHKVYVNVRPGEKFALPDGDYYASLDFKVESDENIRPIRLFTKQGAEFAPDLSRDDYLCDTACILFSVKDGKPDKELHFYVKDYDPNDYSYYPPELVTD